MADISPSLTNYLVIMIQVTFTSGVDSNVMHFAPGTTLGQAKSIGAASVGQSTTAQATINGVPVGDAELLENGSTVVLQSVSHSKAS